MSLDGASGLVSREGYVTGHPGNDGRYDGDITSGTVLFEVAVARLDVSFGYDLPAFRDEGETGFLDGFLNEILSEPLAGVNMFDAAFEGLVEFFPGKAERDGTTRGFRDRWRCRCRRRRHSSSSC